MIPTKIDNALTGSLGGNTKALSIDLTSLSHIMTVLTDLYSDPEQAIIREYSTNALDSHAMAGTTRPIEVTTPSPLRQTFEVQDFGLGMSVDDILETYGTYGASSKRENNIVNGCLGLGSKSALTYTTMFTVRAVKNGVMAEVAIYRDDTGAGSMEVIDTKSTTLPNGVRIIVPTATGSNFFFKSNAFFQYWKRGTVLVNGVEPTPVTEHDGVVWLDDKTMVYPSTAWRGSSVVVMGNVAYPHHTTALRYNSIYFADMGEVAFVPSREGLNNTPETQRVTQNFDRTTGLQNVVDTVQNLISAAPGLTTAVQIWHNRAMVVANNNFFYGSVNLRKTEPLTETRGFDKDVDRLSKPFKVTSVSLSDINRLIFLDIGNNVFTATRKAKMLRWIESQGMVDPLIVQAPKPTNALYADAKSLDTAALDAVSVPKVKRAKAKPKPKPTYPWVAYKDHLYNTSRELPAGRPLVYTTQNTSTVRNSWMEREHNTVFVQVTYPRLTKFERENPSAIPLSEWLKIEQKNIRGLTEDETDAYWLDFTGRRIIDTMDLSKINDPWFARIAKIDKDALGRLVSESKTFGKSLPDRPTSLHMNLYPLAQPRYPDHTIAYINAIYRKDA